MKATLLYNNFNKIYPKAVEKNIPFKKYSPHVHYNFYLEGISRALLQELARHREANLSVKSTRYTLKELKNEGMFETPSSLLMKDIVSFRGNTMLSKNEVINSLNETQKKMVDYDIFYLQYCIYQKSINRAAKYLVYTDNTMVNIASIEALEKLRLSLKEGISSDKAKYCLPESYKTELTWTITAKSLHNFLSLRSNKAALWEIRNLAKKIYDTIPEDQKWMFKDCMSKDHLSD